MKIIEWIKKLLNNKKNRGLESIQRTLSTKKLTKKRLDKINKPLINFSTSFKYISILTEHQHVFITIPKLNIRNKEISFIKNKKGGIEIQLEEDMINILEPYDLEIHINGGKI